MKCPGQDMQYWDAEAIFDVTCPECEAQVEFYKDDTTRACPSCGHRFVNPKMDFGCAAYCKYAEQCIGTLPEEFVGSQDNLLKDKVAVEMKRYYKTDFKRIGHVSRVARHAEKIGKDEGANLAVVLCAAYLNNIGRSGEDAGTSSENPTDTSLTVARSILTSLGAKEAILQEVCDLLAVHDDSTHPGSPEGQVLSDAILLAELEEQHKEGELDPEIAGENLETRFFTSTARQLAKGAFAPEKTHERT
jgi:hypothetical protein